ncbi:esterase, partial [Rhizobium ruizarguesonis]
KVAGLILAAPVAAVDQDTRDNYAVQVSGLMVTAKTRPASLKNCDEVRPTPSCRP